MNLLTQDPITFWFRRTRRWKLSRATRLLRGDEDGRGLADTLRQIRMMRTIRPTSSAAALVPRQRSNQLHSRAFLFFFFCVVVIVRLCQVAALGLNRDRTHRDLFPLLRRKPRLTRSSNERVHCHHITAMRSYASVFNVSVVPGDSSRSIVSVTFVFEMLGPRAASTFCAIKPMPRVLSDRSMRW